MSDARNSANSLRGGGAKQTGGVGRTHKAISGRNGTTPKNGLEDFEKKDARSEAKRMLQLQIMSKQLANSVREACLTYHTEEEFEEFDIPMPDPGTALKKLKAMREFTQNWYDKDFRDEWLQRVTEIWEKELMDEYARAFAAEKEKREAAAKASNSSTVDETPMTIEELEAKISSLEAGSEERARLKKKLKKKKQKQNKKEVNDDNGDGDLD